MALSLLAGCPSRPSAARLPPQPGKPLAVGELAKIGDLTVSVVGWSEIPGSEPFIPAAGMRYVGVDILLVNQGSLADGLMNFGLKDGETSYSLDLGPTMLAKGALAVVVQPGERVRTVVGFEIPKATKGLVFDFGKTAQHADAHLLVDLGATPVSKEPPSTVPGETAASLHAIGEAVPFDGLVLTVHGFEALGADSLFKSSDGMRFVAVDVTLENTRATSAKVPIFMGAHVTESTGRTHDVDVLGAGLLAGGALDPSLELESGAKKRGKLSFQVPRDAKDLAFELVSTFPPTTPKVSVRLPDLEPIAPPAPPPAAALPLIEKLKAQEKAIDAATEARELEPTFRACREAKATIAEIAAIDSATAVSLRKELDDRVPVLQAFLFEGYSKEAEAILAELPTLEGEKKAEKRRALDALLAEMRTEGPLVSKAADDFEARASK